jgi:hypothetical protein
LEEVYTLDKLGVEDQRQLTLDARGQLCQEILLSFKFIELYPHELVILLYADRDIFWYFSYDRELLGVFCQFLVLNCDLVPHVHFYCDV